MDHNYSRSLNVLTAKSLLLWRTKWPGKSCSSCLLFSPGKPDEELHVFYLDYRFYIISVCSGTLEEVQRSVVVIPGPSRTSAWKKSGKLSKWHKLPYISQRTRETVKKFGSIRWVNFKQVYSKHLVISIYLWKRVKDLKKGTAGQDIHVKKKKKKSKTVIMDTIDRKGA